MGCGIRSRSPIRREYFNVEQFENFIEHEYKQKYSVLENIVTFWKLRKKMNNLNSWHHAGCRG